MAKSNVDLSKLSAAEQKQINDILAKHGTNLQGITGASSLSDPAYRQRCLEAKPKFEAMALKEGLTLAHIFTVSAKAPVTYRGPDGKVFNGRGKKPSWLVGHEAEYKATTTSN